MALRTQYQPYVDFGNLADRPDPARTPEGYLYRARDTGQCFICVDNAGVRLWEPFCGFATGLQGNTLMLFAGSTSSIGSAPQFLCDDATGAVGAPGLGYPVPSTGYEAVELVINVRSNTVGGITPFAVQLYQNGVAVGTAISVLPGATGVSKQSQLGTLFAAFSKLDVGIAAATGLSGAVSISATVVAR